MALAGTGIYVVGEVRLDREADRQLPLDDQFQNSPGDGRWFGMNTFPVIPD
jgi:hypothetical protein